MANLQPDTPSDDWKAMDPYWTMAADLLEGATAVRKAGVAYLPKLPDETWDSYEHRRANAKYTNIFADIVANLAAKPFRKEVAIKDGARSPAIMSLVEDIDGRGNNLHVFAAETFFSGIAFAIDWILVDHTKAKAREDGRRLSLAEERQQGLRPYWVRVPARNMLAVESTSVGGREEITYARILEPTRVREGFAERDVTRVRVLERERLPDGSYGAVTFTLWEKVSERQGRVAWDLIDSGSVSLGIIPLVPFIAGRRRGSSWRFLPPMQDAAHLQIEHYQQEAALKAIRELTAFPMLAGIGVHPERDAAGAPKPVRVGPRSVLYAPAGPDGKLGDWRFVEPQGHSLKFLAENIAATEQQLRELGRQPLTAQTGNLTVVSTAFAASKANSVLSAWALNLKDALEQALAYTAMWLNEAAEPEVEIEDDFDVGLHDDKGPESLLEMRKAGDISQATLWGEFKRRGILSPEFDPDRERQRLEEENPDPDGEDDLVAASCRSRRPVPLKGPKHEAGEDLP